MRETMVKLIGYYFCCAIFAILLLVTFTSRTADAQTSKRTAVSYIVAGKSVGRINIEDTLDSVFQLYPKLKRSSYTTAKGCSYGNLELPDSLMLIIRDERVAQITVKNDYSKTVPETAEKIQPGSSAASVKQAYPNADKAFTKLNETSASTGYEPLIYWVDKNAGLAFEFYTDASRGRLVNAVHVFAPNGQFLFNDGCDKNEDLRELPAFATKVLEKMIRDYQE